MPASTSDDPEMDGVLIRVFDEAWIDILPMVGPMACLSRTDAVIAGALFSNGPRSPAFDGAEV